MHQKLVQNPETFDPKQMQVLLSFSDKIRKNTREVVEILKKASEIEAILANKVDSLQLLVILEQLPRLLSKVVEDTLKHIIEDIVGYLSVCEKDEISKHPFLGKLRAHEIANATSFIVSEMNAAIRELRVPGVVDPASVESEKTVIMEQVRDMMLSVERDAPDLCES